MITSEFDEANASIDTPNGRRRFLELRQTSQRSDISWRGKSAGFFSSFWWKKSDLDFFLGFGLKVSFWPQSVWATISVLEAVGFDAASDCRYFISSYDAKYDPVEFEFLSEFAFQS